MKFFKEKFYKIQNSGQGADNPSYDSNTDRKRLMWIQQFASKHKNYTKIFIGAYIVCSFLLMIFLNYVDNFDFRFSNEIETGNKISLLETVYLHSVFLFIVLPIIAFVLYLVFAYKINVSYGNLNVGQKGTARWSTRDEIKSQYKGVPLKGEGFKGMGGIPVAREKETLYIDDTNTNNLVLGTTRSGKGEIIVNPMSETISRAEEKCSMILTDPKLELAFMQIPELEKRGYECHILNLIDLEFSACFNPLKLITDEYEFEIENKHNDTSNTQQMCESVAHSLFADNPNDPQPFFNIGSRDLFSAGVYACIEDAYKEDIKENELKRIFYEEEEKKSEEEWAKVRFSKLYKRYFLCKFIEKLNLENIEPTIFDNEILLLNYLNDLCIEGKLRGDVEIPKKETIEEIIYFYKKIYNRKEDGKYINRYEKKKFKRTKRNANKITIGSVINLIVELNSNNTLDVYFTNRPEGNFAKIKYATVLTAGSKAKGDLVSTFFSKVSSFIPTNIQRMTSKNSFDIIDIGFGEKPLAIFIGLPDYDQSKNFLASIFIDQVYMTLSKLASATVEKKVPRRVHFILDEFGNLPALNDMGARIKLGLGRNLIYTLIVQDLSSIHDIYKEEATAIISNCGNKVYIKAGDNETNEEFSKLLGNETYVNINRSGKFLSLNKERTEIIEERPLLTAEELGKLKMGEMIIHRTMKRTDNFGRAITTYPIANIGENRMLYRYEYMPEIFNVQQLLYKSVNIERLITKYSRYSLNNFNIVSNFKIERTDNIDLNNITVKVSDFFSWQRKKNLFVDFNKPYEEHIHSFILNLEDKYLKRDEKMLLQTLSYANLKDEEILLTKDKLEEMSRRGRIVKYEDVESLCIMGMQNENNSIKEKIYLAKIYVELHRYKYNFYYLNKVLTSKKARNDYMQEETKDLGEYYVN